MVLKLNGKPLDLSPKSPGVEAVRLFLDKLPQDEVLTTDVLVKRAKTSSSTCTKAKQNMAGYSLVVGRNCYWGHPKAIQALKKQVIA